MTTAAPDNPYSQGLAYVDGQIWALADARLPLVEAGFTRSDVTYDVVAVWNGKFSGWRIIWLGSRGAALPCA